MTRKRARELGIPCGVLPTGVHNAITDVAGVLVGHCTLHEGDNCTGVTAILPHEGNLFQEKVVAAVHVLNGFGKSIGLSQIMELGQLETPIMLTGTLSAPKVADALISWMLKHDESITSINAVVGECNDSFLDDIRSRALTEEHVFAALNMAAGAVVAEGAVGAGAGMTAYGYKGGIGTASRLLPSELGGYTVGILVLANFGAPRDLLIGGIPVGRLLQTPLPGVASAGSAPTPSSFGFVNHDQSDEADHLGDGSIMMILATDAPLSSRQLGRLAKRPPLGLARTGAVASHGSGDYVIAFSTAERLPHTRPGESSSVRQALRLYEDGRLLTALFSAAVEATEEAIYNSLCMAKETTGFKGNTRSALPLEQVVQILRDHNRIQEV